MTADHSLPAKHWHGRIIDARLQLLDHQILDSRGDAVGTVDDIELDGVPRHVDIAPGTKAPTVASLVSGHLVVTRVFGGRPPKSRMQYITLTLVRHIGTVVELRPTDREFDSLWAEHWLRRQIISRIPGGQHRAGK